MAQFWPMAGTEAKSCSEHQTAPGQSEELQEGDALCAELDQPETEGFYQQKSGGLNRKLRVHEQ